MQSLNKKRNEYCWSYRLYKLGTPYALRMEKNVKVQHPSPTEKYLLNVHKIEGAHLQCVNNYNVKFE